MRSSSKGDISINSGSVTALSYSTLYFLYYDDPTLAGGAVSYAVSTSKTTALQGSGRFYIGSITTPLATAPNSSGNGDGGVGAQYGSTPIFLGGSSVVSGISGAPTTGNTGNIIDGDLTTFCQFKTVNTGSSQAQGATYTITGFSPTGLPYSSLTLNARSAVPTNPASGISVSCQYSLDGGSTFTTIWSISAGTTRALTTDTVSLPVSQNLGLLVVKFLPNRTAGQIVAELDMYEVWVVGIT